jgi:PAS domain S-box-containing protein
LPVPRPCCCCSSSEDCPPSWTGGAEQIAGYRTEEILGKYVSAFYTPEQAAIGKPTIELKAAREQGRFEDDGWRVRKDGSQFRANVVVTPLQDHTGLLRGFAKITRDITEKRAASRN